MLRFVPWLIPSEPDPRGQRDYVARALPMQSARRSPAGRRERGKEVDRGVGTPQSKREAKQGHPSIVDVVLRVQRENWHVGKDASLYQ